MQGIGHHTKIETEFGDLRLSAVLGATNIGMLGGDITAANGGGTSGRTNNDNNNNYDNTMREVFKRKIVGGVLKVVDSDIVIEDDSSKSISPDKNSEDMDKNPNFPNAQEGRSRRQRVQSHQHMHVFRQRQTFQSPVYAV